MLYLFISATPADTLFKDALVKHLASLRRAGKIEIWSEGEVALGAVWDTVTKQQLQQADVVVLLLSDDFMASDRIWENELKESLERRAKGDAVMLLPILVRPCVIKNTVLETIQGLPRDGRAVSQYSNQDEAWYKIATEIGQLASDFPSVIGKIRQSTTTLPSAQVQEAFGSQNTISGSVIIVGGKSNAADVLILAPLPLELKAVMRYLEQQEAPEVIDQMAYEKGYFSGKKRRWRIVVAEPGMENTPTALALERGIRRFRPKIALLLGIAGGVKNNVQIGDVVVGTKAYGYEAGKEGAGEFWARPSVESFSRDLLAHATLCSRRDDWKRRAAQDAGDASVWFGPIAAGNKVITSKQSETYHRLKQHYENTLALDMESSGFAEALPTHRGVHGLVIRGISDLLDHKGDDFQKTAADRAAAFAFELLYQMDDDQFTKEENPLPNAPTGSNIRIENSENVIVGGQYNITGDFHLGNKG